MITREVLIDEKCVYLQAKRRFLEISGLRLDTERDNQMMKMAEKVRCSFFADRKVKALLGFYHHDDGRCMPFLLPESLGEKAYQDAYFFMITLGAVDSDGPENIMEDLYVDMWGTSYIDAAMAYLKENYIAPEMRRQFGSEVELSPVLGPGYFGIPVEETGTLFNFLQGERLGVTLTNSGMMNPEKSCVGYYLIYPEGEVHVDEKCKNCAGQAGGCQFCAVKRGR